MTGVRRLVGTLGDKVSVRGNQGSPRGTGVGKGRDDVTAVGTNIHTAPHVAPEGEDDVSVEGSAASVRRLSSRPNSEHGTLTLPFSGCTNMRHCAHLGKHSYYVGVPAAGCAIGSRQNRTAAAWQGECQSISGGVDAPCAS